MKIYKTQSEVEKDIVNGVLAINGDVKFECLISIEAKIIVTAGDITAGDIIAGDITAEDIIAGDITAGNITARNISTGDITARDINAWDITAGNITAGNITAGNITARNITARNILYYAFCTAYNSIKCISIKARRKKHQEPICLDGTLEITKKEEKKSLSGKTVKVEIDGVSYEALIK